MFARLLDKGRAVENQPKLTSVQQEEGWNILRSYYEQFVLTLGQWQEPVAVEGRLEGRLHVAQVEFKITGRYDRLEHLPGQDATAQLHLIDYKTSKALKTSSELEVVLQLGLYQIAMKLQLMLTSKSSAKNGSSNALSWLS